jgi:fucose permease
MHSSSRQNLITIGLAYLGFLSLGMYAGLLGLAWPSMQTDYNLTLADQGVLLLASTVTSLITSFYSGALAHRFGIGRMLVVGNAAIAVSLFIIAFIHSWPLLIFVMLIIGAGSGAIDAGINTYAAQHFTPRVMNWLHASFGIGVTLTPLMMTAIFSAKSSWRLGYVITGIVIAVTAVCYLLTQSRWRSTIVLQADSSTPAKRISMGQTLRLPIVWIGIAMLFLVAGLESTPGNWMFTVFTKGRGIAEVAAAQWVSVYWASFTVGRIFFGFIISRVNPTIMLRVVMLIGVIGAGLLWWNAAPWIGFAGLTILGFSLAPIYPVMTSDTPRRVGVEHSNNAVGFQVAGAGVGLALLPAFAGILAEHISLEIIPPIVLISYVLMFVLFQLSRAYSPRIESIAQPATEA